MNISRRTAIQASAASLAALALPQVIEAKSKLVLESDPNHLWVTNEQTNGLTMCLDESDRCDRFVDVFQNLCSEFWWFSDEGLIENDLNIVITQPLDKFTIFNKLFDSVFLPKESHVYVTYKDKLYKTKLAYKCFVPNYFPTYFAKLLPGLVEKHYMCLHYDIISVSPLVSNTYKFVIKNKRGQIETVHQHAVSIRTAISKINYYHCKPKIVSLEQV